MCPKFIFPWGLESCSCINLQEKSLPAERIKTPPCRALQELQSGDISVFEHLVLLKSDRRIRSGFSDHSDLLQPIYFLATPTPSSFAQFHSEIFVAWRHLAPFHSAEASRRRSRTCTEQIKSKWMHCRLDLKELPDISTNYRITTLGQNMTFSTKLEQHANIAGKAIL